MAPTDRERRSGFAAGFAAALLFGASAPVAKLLLPALGPVALAGVMYGGAGLLLAAVSPILSRGPRPREARLRPSDAPALAAVTLSGGVAGPLLMLWGLDRVSGLAGSLLLNLEGPATILVAVALFGEHLGRREAAAAAAIFAGAALLTAGPGAFEASLPGALAIAGACACWAIDNNLTQRLSLRNPVAIVRFKALAAGAFNLVLAAAIGDAEPTAAVVTAAVALGALSYGLSVVLDVYALRHLGAAREAAVFGTAPFAGAVVAIALGDRPGWAEASGGAVMLAGAALLLSARHGHAHEHEAIEHDHVHVHDEHHRHEHEGPFEEPHAHAHRHAPLVHDHPHVSDAHHRHGHGHG